jgi:alcohol dehydrogenase class IV
MRVAYAFSTALISVFPQVGQGEGYSAQLGTVLRRVGGRDPAAMARIARGLGLDSVAAAAAPQQIAEKMEEGFRSLGMPTRLSELSIARERLPEVLEHSLRNFNADPKREFVRERELLGEILESAW